MLGKRYVFSHETWTQLCKLIMPSIINQRGQKELGLSAGRTETAIVSYRLGRKDAILTDAAAKRSLVVCSTLGSLRAEV
jgi:hypothetical protein